MVDLTAVPEQSALVEAFAAGRVIGASAPIECFDTHLSHVFLSADKAFKLKRAVQLPFVDFSSLERRRAACEAELRVNCVMAAPLYLGAAPITREDSQFRIGGEGAAVDWVVQMRRFNTAEQFDRLASGGGLTRALVDEAAEMIANAHDRAPPSSMEGHAADYFQIIRQLRRTEADGAKHMDLASGSPLLFERLESELGRVSGLIEQRRKTGKVRHVHGDLHLRNLCLFKGKPLAFDALEFDDRLATIDVLYDLAFLLMDLRRLGLNSYANAAMNRYWDVAGEDEAAAALLPFFMSLRATVRMAVAVEASDLQEAQTYRALGLALLERQAPRMIAIGGLSGTGKTAVSRALAPLLPGAVGARILRSDVLRKRGHDLEAPAEAAAYAPARRSKIYRQIVARATEALEAGVSVIADATYREASARECMRFAARKAPFNAYWLNAPLEVRLARISGRFGDASDADVQVAKAQEEPLDLGAFWRPLDASRPVDALVTDILGDPPS